MGAAAVLAPPAVASEGPVPARAPGPPPDLAVGGDGQVRVRTVLGASETSVLESRRRGRWREVWRCPPPAEDGERGARLRWQEAQGGQGPGAIRYGWEASAELCGHGRVWLNPQRYSPRRQRFEPLLAWAPRPPRAARVQPAGAPSHPVLAPVARPTFAVGGARAGAPAALADDDLTTGWGRAGEGPAGDLAAQVRLSLATPARKLVLHPSPGIPLPSELWLYAQAGTWRVHAGTTPQALSIDLALPPGADCLALVVPSGVRGRIGELRVLSEADLAGARGPGLVSHALRTQSGAALARLTGSGSVGLDALAAVGPATRSAGTTWTRAVWATGAPGAADLLLDRLDETAGAARLALEATLVGRESLLAEPVARRLLTRPPGDLLALLGWLQRRPQALGGCSGAGVRALVRLLSPSVALDPLWRALHVARVAGCPAHGGAVAGLVAHEDEQTRVAALQALAAVVERGTCEAAAAPCAGLVQALEDPSPAVRSAAWGALGGLALRADSACRAALSAAPCPKPRRVWGAPAEPWPMVREAALKAAVAVSTDRPDAELLLALGDPAPGVRARAVAVLGLMGAEGFPAEPVAERVLDPQEATATRSLAVDALLGMGAVAAGVRQRCAALLERASGDGPALGERLRRGSAPPSPAGPGEAASEPR